MRRNQFEADDRRHQRKQKKQPPERDGVFEKCNADQRRAARPDTCPHRIGGTQRDRGDGFVEQGETGEGTYPEPNRPGPFAEVVRQFQAGGESLFLLEPEEFKFD